MNCCLKFGQFSRFYLLIIYSFLVKLLINILFSLEYHHPYQMKIANCSIVKYPVLNNHFLIYFIFYYFGYLLFSFIFLGNRYRKETNIIDYNININDSFEINKINTSNSLRTQSKQSSTKANSEFLSFFLPNISKTQLNKILFNIFLISFIYMVSEMIIYFLDQKNHTYINFCLFQIIFIHFFLYRKDKNKLYKHQILSFALILILGFGIKLISSLTKQCEYPVKDPDEGLDLMPEFFRETIRESTIKVNEKGLRACKNAYNIFFDKSGDFYSFIIIAILGYLIGNLLYSFSVVNIRDLINKKYIPHYTLIFFIGCLGLIMTLLSITVSSLISCGTSYSDSKNRISFLCQSIKILNETEDHKIYSENYFDSFISYKTNLHDAYYLYQPGEDGKKKKDVILEIIFTCFLPIFTFAKANFDFLIIKELGPFHILFPEILLQITKDFIIIIYKIYKKLVDGTQIKQFIFITVANIVVFIGLCIYLELLELHFCKLDKNIKKNIAMRSISDIQTNEEGLVDNEIFFGDSKYGINERDSYTG